MEPFSFPNKTQDYPQAQGLSLAIIPWAAVITWDLVNQQNAEIILTANTTFAMPVGIKYGRFYGIEVIQDGTGSRLITWNAAFKSTSGLTLVTAANQSNFLTFKGISSTTLSLVGSATCTRA